MKKKEEQPSSGSKIIETLIRIQKDFGYLPEEKLKEVATLFGVPESQIWGVATFYNVFRLKPKGKTHIKICMGTACHLSGGERVLEAAERELKITVGDTTPDLRFSLERVACIGCCMLAPVVVVDGKVYPRMSPLKFEELLIGLGEKGSD
ncbi:MAG: NADH-quinone oxidoreductase subunit NuoE [Desulfobacterota bacterium]|nr:NADH-quinone oxidoreductase subunit NuoE [Thermodesulfobacteriota bacterium]MDW8002461.1 NADH-quinone oxidoreductase subunit NuoE [Deltaproteobacteria bacterium]